MNPDIKRKKSKLSITVLAHWKRTPNMIAQDASRNKFHMYNICVHSMALMSKQRVSQSSILGFQLLRATEFACVCEHARKGKVWHHAMQTGPRQNGKSDGIQNERQSLARTRKKAI